VVALWVGLGPQRGHHLSVHLNAALRDQLLGVAAACDSSLGKNLLQPLKLRRSLGCLGFAFIRCFRRPQVRILVACLFQGVVARGVRCLFCLERIIRRTSHLWPGVLRHVHFRT
jgi:hypothetical protein